MAEAIGVGITIFFVALLIQEFWPLLVLGLAALVLWGLGTALSNTYPLSMHVADRVLGFAAFGWFFVLPPLAWIVRRHGWLTVAGSAETTPRPAKVGDVN